MAEIDIYGRTVTYDPDVPYRVPDAGGGSIGFLSFNMEGFLELVARGDFPEEQTVAAARDLLGACELFRNHDPEVAAAVFTSPIMMGGDRDFDGARDTVQGVKNTIAVLDQIVADHKPSERVSE